MTFTQYEELKKNGLTDEQIQMAAQSRGVELPKESILGGIVKTAVVKPALRFGQAVGALGVSAFGNEEQKARLDQALQKDRILNLPGLGEVKVEGQKALGQGGGKQIVADVLEQAATYMPYGRVAKIAAVPASKLFGKAAGKVLGYSAAGATGGYGMDVAQGLRSGEENPYTPGVGTAIGGAIPLVPSVARGVGNVAKFGVTQMTGLNRETVSTLLINPQALTKAQQEGLDRVSLANQVKEAFSKRSAELSHTGAEYDAIKNINKKINIRDTKLIPTGSYTSQRVETDIPTKVLNKFGIRVKNGRVMRGPENTPLTGADRRAIEDFISDFGDATELTPKGILNARRAIDNMAAYDKNKSDLPKAIAMALRKEYDVIAKREVPGLKELDEKFAPEIEFIEKLRKDFIGPDGNLKDAAINKIANSVGKGKDQLLERLEKLVPGIGQKAQILKALEDIGATEGNKVGTYVRGGNVFTGFAAALAGGPVAGVVSAIVSSPQVAVPILKTVGRARGWTDDAVTNLISKLTTGKTLTGSELVMFRAAIGDHVEKLSPGDQFLETKMGKAVERYNNTAQPGLSIQPNFDAKKIALKMDGDDFVKLEKYSRMLDSNEKIPIDFGMEMENLLGVDGMGVDVLEKKTDTFASKEALQKAIHDILAAKEMGMKKLPVTRMQPSAR